MFKFENLTPVHTPATIDATGIQQCFCLKMTCNDHADSCIAGTADCRIFRFSFGIAGLL